MTERISKARRLRELIAARVVAMPGVPNASMARQVERAGFDALYISGAGLANCAAGLPDVGLLTLNEVATLAGFIAQAVKIPAIVDADTGFGGAENVGRTIYELGRAGLAGCHLEDQEFPKRCGHLAGKRLVETDEMSAKISAAVAAKRDPDFLVIARTDSRALENFDGAVKRAQSYVTAGADAIFPEALQTKEEFRDFAREVKVPLLANMTEFGRTPFFTAAERENAGCQHRLFFSQVEYCDNLIFHRRAALDNLGQRLLDANRTIGQPNKITVIFGRKVTKQYRGKLQTEIEDMNLPNPVVRSHYRNGFIKQYVRDHLILRTEAASNNVNDYGVNKAVENLPVLQKSLSAINDNYLNVQQDILETFVDRGQLRRLAQPTITSTGKRIPGLKLDHPRQLALMHALVRFAHIAAANTFTTAEIHPAVIKALGCAPDNYTLASLRSLETPSQRSCRQASELATLSTPSAGVLDLLGVPKALRTDLCPTRGRPSQPYQS